MFLNSLSPIEKDNFMKLAVSIIKADGVIEESEKQILASYAKEMQISVYNLEEQVDTNAAIEELVESSTLQSKRIIFVELLALAFADGHYTIEEEEIIQQLANAFKLDSAFIKQAINLEDAYISVYMSLINLVEKGE